MLSAQLADVLINVLQYTMFTNRSKDLYYSKPMYVVDLS